MGRALGLCVAATAQADPVTHWNGITVNAVTAGRGGPPGLLDIALVHLAVHDAVQAIEGRWAADEEARRLGERVAHWVFQKFLRPAPGSK